MNKKKQEIELPSETLLISFEPDDIELLKILKKKKKQLEG